MSLRYLPTSAFIVIVLIFSVVLLLYTARIYAKEKKLLVVGYGLLGLAGLCAATNRAIEEYLKEVEQFTKAINTISGIFLISSFSLIMICTWQKTREDPIMRRIFIISLRIIMIAILVTSVVILVFKK